MKRVRIGVIGLGGMGQAHMNSECRLYCESSTFSVFDTPFARIGINICFDNKFCEYARILAIRGAGILFASVCYGALDNPKAETLSLEIISGGTG